MIAHGPWDIMQNEQVLKFKGLQLHEDRHTLSHYNIQNNDIVTCSQYMVARSTTIQI